MADIRINSLPSTATSFNTDDYIPIDGASGGTRKMLAATLPLTDVKFGGASGPSAKSSIAARAARQGLVFDGTQVAGTTSVPAFGTAAFTASAIISPTFTSNGTYIFGGASGAFDLFVDSSGVLNAGKVGVSAISSGTTLTAGKYVLVTYVRTSTSASGAAFYVNGVLVATVTDANDYTTAITLIGNAVTSTSAYQFVGGLEQPYLYNRALSAAEVVSLYEAGVPSGADYNSASNTSINTSACVNLSYTSFTGASASGFTAVANGICYARTAPTATITAGQRVRLTGTLTLNNGKTVVPQVYVDNSGTSVALTAGSFNVTISGGTAATASNIIFTTSGDADYTISSLSITRLGLLLAPDAAQAGGGLTWYDTSGNAANITLPASGVTWNVPTSGKINALTVTKGALTVSNTDINAYLALTDTSRSYQVYSNSGTFGIYDATAPAVRLAIPSTGNVLIGTTTDGGQKLQVAGTAAITGAISIGNTVTTGVAVASTHKVQISIGGTTYYLLASNV